MSNFNKGMMALLGVAMGVNGIVMLYDPQFWYYAVPTVPATGPFNQHFIRDIGIIYVMIGAGYVTGIFFPAQRIWLWAAATAWLSLHGFFHLWEIGVGICGADTILKNGHAVYLPAIIGFLGIVIDVLGRRSVIRS
ncbi:hypothetical protein [Sphingomonas lycopersici]|uniref:DUF4345 domain-containing protein n=1 Tax=Sphingomonas lycopersici TaxID=2951807 RepID=A0AA42CVM4_9SPHN|nr:hypothetical protein [Sphingomonas lycopersici]MCW6530777.1 hypothetical protein [Sphingomonas lycopersici]MCW6536748.1 hypothetical protein [Sphingomonas lycopersici]